MRIHYLIRLAIFWMLYFLFFKLCFFIYHFGKLEEKGFFNNAYSIVAGWRLDLSMVSYAIIPSFLLWVIQQFNRNRIVHRINFWLIVFLLILFTILQTVNIKLYEEWGTIVNNRVIDYLSNPREVFHFISVTIFIVGVIFMSIIISVFLGFYKNFAVNFSFVSEKKYLKYIVIILFPLFTGVTIRGGLQLSPVNESVAIHSNFPNNNHLAINPIWYFFHSIIDSKSGENLFIFMDINEARKIKNSLFVESKNTSSFTNIEKPNIIIIVLESFTADIIEPLGGEKNITPNLNKICNKGILFTNAYGSGTRTEQGLVSILSGFPAQPNVSIINNPSKADKLPSIARELKNKSYSTSFFYGGEIEFANMKSYLINSGYEKIIDKHDFNSEEMNSKWGAHDEFVFKKQISDLKNEKQPFFSTILTLSSHEPFEVPMTPMFENNSTENKFRNAAHYTDYALGKYFEEVKKQEWFKNTIFILVADHGHHLPHNRNLNMPESRKIPIVIYGETIKGKEVNKYTSQNDIPAIILSNLKIPYQQFNWSNNTLDSTVNSFAYYSNPNVLGFITNEDTLVYSYDSKQNLITPKNDSFTIKAKAYLQTLYQEYLDL